jgi:uncharacterized protein (DUF2141 family)
MCKQLLLYALLLMASFMCRAQGNLTVKIENIKNNNGDILIGLYDSLARFPRKVSTGKVIKVTGKEMHVKFSDVKPGKYAVSVLHDENQNKDLDQGVLGKPKEGFGFSNNVMGIIGPPSFKKASFYVPKGKSSISIKMRYLKNSK